MKETTIKALTAAVIGGVSAYLGALLMPIIVLFVVMCIDYVSGIMKAYMTAELSSKIGRRGIIKKVCYLFIIAVALVVDWLIDSAFSRLGVQFDSSLYVGLTVTVWLIINELISILENLAVIGVPLPKFLTSLVKKLKIVVEDTGEKEKEE